MTANQILEPAIAAKIRERGLVLYDGECGFCNFWVRFIIARDPHGYFLFAPLQSRLAGELCGARLQEAGDTVLVYIEGTLFSRSDAVVQIATRLSFPWNFFRLVTYVPRRVRDRVYELVAGNRHRWLKSHACATPSAEERSRFLG